MTDHRIAELQRQYDQARGKAADAKRNEAEAFDRLNRARMVKHVSPERPNKDRDAIIVAKRQEGMTVKQISEVFRISVVRVRYIVDRASIQQKVNDWADGLGTRARSILRNEFMLVLPVGETPSEERLQRVKYEIAHMGMIGLLRHPNCGRVTAYELLDWAEINPLGETVVDAPGRSHPALTTQRNVIL